MKLLHKSHSDRYERLLRPFVEPVYRCAVNQGWELSRPYSEGGANRREAKDDFQLLPYTVYEELPADFAGVGEAGAFYLYCKKRKEVRTR